MNWLIMSTTYVCFHRALRVQGRPREGLPYMSRLLPYGAYRKQAFSVIVCEN